MTLFRAKTNRRILPRWRDSHNLATSVDLQALRPSKRPAVSASGVIPDVLRDLALEFERHRNLGSAAELISSALLVGQPESAMRAAEFIIAQHNEAPKALASMAHGLISNSHPFQVDPATPERVRIARTRQLLRLHPHNPMLWSDMARHHAAYGDKTRARKCMTAALSLAPDHRWILRTAARFMVHCGDAAGAQRLLVRNVRTKTDPWLVAAELACAQVAGRAPKFWRQAKDFVRNASFAPKHLSELTTAVAMMELEGGERKLARRLVFKGLTDPTENTLAQIYWAIENRHLNDGFGLEELLRRRNDAYEADFQQKLNAGDISSALASAKTWREDEPFAARPCLAIAYAATLLDDYSSAVDMQEQVRIIDNKIPTTLELNAIYSQLSSRQLVLDRDAEVLGRILNRLHALAEHMGADPYHALANIGLWHYRYGSVDVGYKAYEEAINAAHKLRQAEPAAAAAVYAAREAILARDPRASTVLQRARDLTGKAPTKACEFYLRKVEALADHPDHADTILSPTSSARFLDVAAPKKPKVRFTITREGATIWIPKPR